MVVALEDQGGTCVPNVQTFKCLTGTSVVLIISSCRNVSMFLVGIRLEGGEREHEVGLPESGHLFSLTISG